MDTDVFEQFIEQLQRYVRERLIPAEKEILETETIQIHFQLLSPNCLLNGRL